MTVKSMLKPCNLSLSRCLNQMENDGLSVDDVFNQRAFRQDERDMVLKAVRIVQPDYEPSFDTAAGPCFSSLVQDFYAKVSEARFGTFSHVIDLLKHSQYNTIQYYVATVARPKLIILL